MINKVADKSKKSKSKGAASKRRDCRGLNNRPRNDKVGLPRGICASYIAYRR